MTSCVKYASVAEYFRGRLYKKEPLLNNFVLRPIAKSTDLKISEVRAALLGLGYQLVENSHGLLEWRFKK
jgi:hypothetical protein